MNYIEVRKKYIEYYKQHNHTEVPNCSLVPENDPSVLYVNAGMFPLVPFLLGEKHPAGDKLTNVQRCVRTGDIDEVGDKSHCTAFEMVGNWSLNAYFKKEALEMTYDFFVNVLGIDPNMLYGTVFAGDEDAPRDDESIEILQNIFKKYGIEAKAGSGERIQLYDKSKNWWGLAGGGPCGTTSEVFIDMGIKSCGSDCHINCDCGKYVELGNNVFMEYLLKDGKYSPLGRHNVDFGGGLERLAMVLQKKQSYFDTDIYLPILECVKRLEKTENIKSERIIVDHIKSATWILMDGVVPGRNEREYVLRRIIRRAVRHGKLLGISESFTSKVAETAINQFGEIYPELISRKDNILEAISNEEEKFNHTLTDGIRIITKDIITPLKNKDENEFKDPDGLAFKTYETYGIPLEMFIEEIENAGIHCDHEEIKHKFDERQNSHVDKSRTASKGLFKGGLADTSEMSRKYHTATHLLLASLRKHISSEIYQAGSNITPERMRFDFPYPTKLTPEQLKTVEEEVNTQIRNSLDVSYTEMPKNEALKLVPFAAFADRYGETVKVYSIGNVSSPFSREICNGPHVKNTAELGTFKIVQHENVGAGVKRIKAILE